MKKLRSTIFATILAFALVGNAFAGNSIGNGLLLPLFDQAIGAFISFFRGDCPVRVCGSCRPEERDSNGDCRPPAN